jgi:hypothetical protein
MPMANKASDQDQKAKFDKLHRATVIINTVQLGAFLVVLVLM